MDTSRAPLGQNALQAILDHVLEHGDAAESIFLEVKSSIDLTKTAGIAKVAKFLLGMSNRSVDVAARHLQGYSVLVLGVGMDDAQGLPRTVEYHEIQNRLRPYLGQRFPSYDFGRLPVGADRDVLFVFGFPPEPGQGAFPCHKNFHGQKGEESLTNGAIYVRGHTETRQATAGEVLDLSDRLQAGARRPPVDLVVGMCGPAHRVTEVDEVLGLLYDRAEKQFTDFKPTTPSSCVPFGLAGLPEPIPQEAREQRLARWKARRNGNVAAGRAHLLGSALQGIRLVVTSRGRFISKPVLRLVLHECTAVEYLEVEDFDLDSLVEPILGRPQPSWPISTWPGRFTPADYPLEWETADRSVMITLTPDAFRPDSPWESDADDLCVIALGEGASVRGTWTLSEDGSDTVTEGELRVPVEPVVSARDLLVPLLRRSQDDE